MRKIVLITALLALVMAMPVFADIEIGASWTPVLADEKSSSEDLESITGFHLGYQWWGIFYATWDSLIMPPDIINGLVGYQRPGFLNLIDAGITIRIGPIVTYVTAGINNVYVYKQEELSGYEPEFGANLRAGAGLKFGWWGVNVSGTAVFASFERMAQTLAALGDDATRDIAFEKIVDGLIPSVNVTLYF
jgi:hypothetical protein